MIGEGRGGVRRFRFLHRDREGERRSVTGGGVVVSIGRLVRHVVAASRGRRTAQREPVAVANVSPGTEGDRE